MKKIFIVCIQATLLFLWGSVALSFFLTGKISSYLHPFFHLWVAGAGLLSLALGASLVFLSLSPLGAHIRCRIQSFNPSAPISLIHLMVLSFPLVSLVFLSPGQFSESFLYQRGIVTSPLDLPIGEPSFSYSAGSNPNPFQEFFYDFPQNESGLQLVTPLDVMYATQIEEIREQLKNRDVEILGQFLPSNSQTEATGEFLIVRLFITCCAADATPLAVICRTQQTLDFPKMSWIKAIGKICFSEENGDVKPIFMVKDVKDAEPPPEKFIY